MSLFICCLWWFVLGLLLGWLLNWLLSRWLRREPPSGTGQATETAGFAPHNEPLPGTHVTEFAPAPPPAIDLAAARAAGFQLEHVDDLTVIEGIGPKIDKLFRAAGIMTHTQLARSSVAEMREILDEGGPDFKIANPASWAQQAQLASENRWAELKKLQDRLIGGVEPTDHV